MLHPGGACRRGFRNDDRRRVRWQFVFESGDSYADAAALWRHGVRRNLGTVGGRVRGHCQRLVVHGRYRVGDALVHRGE